MSEQDLSIVVPIKISRGDIDSLVVSAVEGGCGYWTREIRVDGQGSARIGCGYMGCKIAFVEDEDEGDASQDVEHVLDLTQIGLSGGRCQVVRGLTLMAEKAPRHFADLISDNADATTADVFVQMIFFGEIKYG